MGEVVPVVVEPVQETVEGVERGVVERGVEFDIVGEEGGR